MRIRFREKTAFEAARCMESSGELHKPGQGWYHVYTFRAKPDGGRPVHYLQAGRQHRDGICADELNLPQIALHVGEGRHSELKWKIMV